MRILLLCTLGLLFSCSTPPAAAPAPHSPPVAALPAASADAGPHANDATTPLNPDQAVLLSPAEQAAIEREAAMLADLAAKGIYPETRPTQVTVKYHRSGTTIGLYNEANISQSDYYTTARTSASYKVIPNIEMGALLKALDNLGFYQEALDGIKRVAGASLSVVVRRGSESWTLSWGPAMGKNNNELTQDCADSVRVIFDTTRSVQVVDNPNGDNFFQQEQERINRANARNRVKQDH